MSERTVATGATISIGRPDGRIIDPAPLPGRDVRIAALYPRKDFARHDISPHLT
ncbi:MAG: hypothetical protein RIE31_07150 [Alphaproteobacteria bacterium]